MSGLGSFIQGAFSGYEYGEKNKDRKTQRERDAENYDWTRESRGQERTNWENQNAINERNRTEQARVDASAAEERSVLAAAGQSALDSYNNGQPVEGQPVEGQGGTQTAPIPDAAVNQGQADAAQIAEGATFAPVGAGGNGPQMQPAPDQDQAPTAPRSEQRQSQLAEVAATLGEDVRGYGPGMVDPRLYETAQGAPQGRSVMPATRPQQQGFPADVSNAMADSLLAQPAPTDAERNQQLFDMSAGNAGPQAFAPRPGGPNQQQPVMPGQQQAQQRAEAEAQQAAQAAAAQPNPPAPTARAGQATPAVKAGPPMTPPPSLPEAASAEIEAQSAEQLHDTAVNAPPDQGGAPSVAIAAQTAPTEGRGVLGQDGPIKTTEAQRTQAATSFLDHYAETAVPELVQYYASKGDIERAEAFETWATSREARGTMESWAKSVHAAAIGDDDAFLDHLGDTYNSFDDGYEVVRDKSGFDRDENGQIAGATVTFKNTETGETFERKFEDQADIIEMGIYAMSPERIFDHLFGQLNSAGEIAAEALKHERAIELATIKDGAGQDTRNTALIAAAKKHLSETNFTTWSQLSTAEQDAMALELVRANQAAGAQLSESGGQPAPPPYLGD